jgi:hypothetical protein
MKQASPCSALSRAAVFSSAHRSERISIGLLLPALVSPTVHAWGRMLQRRCGFLRSSSPCCWQETASRQRNTGWFLRAPRSISLGTGSQHKGVPISVLGHPPLFYPFSSRVVFPDMTVLEQARAVTEAFRQHYNQQRPNEARSCENRPPVVALPRLACLAPSA